MKSVFKVGTKKHLKKKMFFDESVDIARYDTVKNVPQQKLYEKMLSFYWTPDEIDVTKDKIDFGKLTKGEQHIFTANLKRQILLDSVQGRSPNIALLPLCSTPELEVLIETWSFFETIHSRSYTHLIRNVYPDPSKVFDEIVTIPEILDCGKDISRHYDLLMHYRGKFGSYEHKRLLYLCMISIYILEGIRFYVSFACSWGFAEIKKMEGNAKIIKLIARDENTHLAASLNILKSFPKEDKDYVKIRKETHNEVIDMFMSAIKQEEEWADYLFKHGSMIGLNSGVLKEYVRWIGAKRFKSAGYTTPYPTQQANPLPWTEKWIGGGNVQVAPQETEITSYLVGGVTQDVKENTFKGLSL
ncbi:MAG: ribonucleotide-diphosphate reductase subunit beta [Gammaproteobacteria bacterium]|nr:ribonucleotide-diphosphate reductase subunit beta [Gammaproteobacteria bacterium]|tara:strand:+ start:43977 stop:45050 length:1074 start_codon:yes stop_codon:yes gene_type:complete